MLLGVLLIVVREGGFELMSPNQTFRYVVRPDPALTATNRVTSHAKPHGGSSKYLSGSVTRSITAHSLDRPDLLPVNDAHVAAVLV